MPNANWTINDNWTIGDWGRRGYVWVDDLVPQHPSVHRPPNLVPLPPENVQAPVRWAAPERNLRVGDRVRWTAVNDQEGEGTVVEFRRLMSVDELHNIPDWVPRDTRHQAYRVRHDPPIMNSEPVIAWFRIQRRLETDE